MSGHAAYTAKRCRQAQRRRQSEAWQDNVFFVTLVTLPTFLGTKFVDGMKELFLCIGK